MPGLAERILEVLEEKGTLAPGDLVSITGEPRYRVLAAFHCLEELGLIAKVYSRGTYKIYQITSLGRMILRSAQGRGLSYSLEKIVLGSADGGEPQATTISQEN